MTNASPVPRSLSDQDFRRGEKPLGTFGRIEWAPEYVAVIGPNPQEALPVTKPNHIAALLAAANDALPFDDRRRFTWDDVDAMRAAWQKATEAGEPAKADRYYWLAEKIAAMLGPRP